MTSTASAAAGHQADDLHEGGTGSGPFVYQALPMRVVFGPGRLDALPDEVARLGLERVLVLCTPDRPQDGERVAEMLGPRAAGVCVEARMHVPRSAADASVAEARRVGADGCVSIGGGSAIGLSKAIALETGLPTVCVPTTYSGSEMTPVWGLTEDGDKRTGRDPVVLPRSVVYDPELTTQLPAATSAASGMNAMAHAVEALYAPDVSPVIALMAEESSRCLAASLPEIVADPASLPARTAALRGSWLAGACLGATTMSLHHRLCHVLGGMFDLPHASTHAVLLPHVAAFNLPAVPAAHAALRRALTTGDGEPAVALAALHRSLPIEPTLAALGLTRADLTAAAEATLARSYANPRSVTRDDVIRILDGAWRGELTSEPAATG